MYQAMMEVPQVNGKKNIKKLVMLHECGLCIHKEEGEDNKWIISHFASGRSVLKYIKSKCDAEGYIENLREIFKDWTFTLEELNSSEWKKELKTEVDVLQTKNTRWGSWA